jgi:hypothetical protein
MKSILNALHLSTIHSRWLLRLLKRRSLPACARPVLFTHPFPSNSANLPAPASPCHYQSRAGRCVAYSFGFGVGVAQTEFTMTPRLGDKRSPLSLGFHNPQLYKC